MAESLFGSLARFEVRADRMRRQRRGIQHRCLIEPRAPGPEDCPVVTVTAAAEERIDEMTCLVLEPIRESVAMTLVRAEWDCLNWCYYSVWQATLPPRSAGTLVRYSIEARRRNGHGCNDTELVPVEEGQAFSYLVGDPAAPAWSRGAVIYQILPDRFYPGDGRSWNTATSLNDIHGGTIKGIIDKLDYISSLGFNCIWLNPFFPDDTHHGYHATDYFAVNHRLGTMDDVRQLIDQAHARGIRLLMDFVANHWGCNHETFQIAQADRESDYYHWYRWKSWPTEYETYYGVRDLPKINLDYPAARAYLMDAVRYWIGEIEFDGLRLDHVLGPSHDFWTELRYVVKALKPDAWMFGEATDSPSVQLSYEGRFDGCLDFMLSQGLRDTFALGTMDVADFDAFLHHHEAYFPAHFSRPSFLDNHDMDRFLWLAKGDRRKARLAALCQFTLGGQPIVYNGTEVGVHQDEGIGSPDSQGMPECRQPMLWGEDQDADLRRFYGCLIRFRRQHPIIWQEARQTVHVDSATGLLANRYANEAEVLLVVLNASDETHSTTIPVRDDECPPRAVTLGPWSGELAVFDSRGNSRQSFVG